MARCFFCHEPLDLEGKIAFRESCPHCGMDAHVCANCRWYDRNFANECREPQAEPVLDREQRNVCEFFVLKPDGPDEADVAAQAKARLDDLFRKK